jgi:hypothetical protein
MPRKQSRAKRSGQTTGPSSSRTQRRGSASTKGRSRRQASRSSSGSSKTTTDHEEIQRWAEQRGGVPACVQGTGDREDVGIIRIEFPKAPNSRHGKLQEIDWEEFFEKFDDQRLALVYQDKLARGGKSNFHKIVKRETGQAKSRQRRAA